MHMSKSSISSLHCNRYKLYNKRRKKLENLKRNGKDKRMKRKGLIITCGMKKDNYVRAMKTEGKLRKIQTKI